MNRIVDVLVVVFALAIGSSGALKCYMCNSAQNASCGDDILNSGFKPVECTPHSTTETQTNKFGIPLPKEISTIFDTDNPQQGDIASSDKVTCTKMNLKVADRKMTVRHCVVAKAVSPDPCSIIQNGLERAADKQQPMPIPTMEFCSVCEKDACNGKMAMVPKAFYMIFPVVTALALGNGNYMA